MTFSRDQLAGIIEASPLAIHSIDLAGIVTGWNAAAERLYGWRADEILGRRLPMVGPEDQAEFASLFAEITAGRTPAARVTTRRRKDGSRVEINLAVAPLCDAAGALVGAVGFSEDITARAAAERALREQAHHLRAILDAIPAPVFYKDGGGVYRGCNKAFEAYLGKSRDEVVGKDVYGLSPKDLADVYKRADDALFAARGHQIYEASVRYADGTRRDVMFHKATFDDERGELAGLIGTILDITTRKQAERALREREEDLATTLDSIGDGVVATDPHGAVARMNRVAERLTGWPLELARGRPLDEVVHVVTGDPPWLVARDGTRRVISSTAAPIHDGRSGGGGDPRGVVLVLRDMTEEALARDAQRALQERLAVSDRLSSVGTLAAGVAHEINNPLAYVLGNLAVIAGMLPRLRHDPDRLRDVEAMIAEIREGGERIRRIVRDLKVFSRADEDVRVPIAVARVLDLAASVAANEIRHRARLIKDYGDVPAVLGNESRLGQVFVNLLVNAAHAIPEGSVERNEIRLVTRSDGNGRVVIEVKDTGAGISDEVRARMFEPFWTTKTIGVGTGLGLSICHGIVTGLGGSIEVDTVLGRGSVFRVLLPASARPIAPAAPPPTAPARVAGRRGRILIADDEPTVGRLLGRLLEEDHDVIVVSNGREALATIHAHGPFDVFLCDIMMPELTGVDVHDALVSSHPALAEQVIFMTGGAFTERARTFLERVPNVRLDKPFSLQEVIELVRSRLR